MVSHIPILDTTSKENIYLPQSSVLISTSFRSIRLLIRFSYRPVSYEDGIVHGERNLYKIYYLPGVERKIKKGHVFLFCNLSRSDRLDLILSGNTIEW